MTCNSCNQPKPCETTEVQQLADLPIDDLASTPDYFLVERTVVDQSTGELLHSITRLPGSRVIPTGNLDNVFTLDANNDTLEVAEGQIVPCYVQNQGTSNVVFAAGEGHPAQFVAIGTYGHLLLCQACGVINMLGGHQYIVGAPYYLSATAGEVTTNPNETGQYLFTPVSETKLLLNLQRK